MIVQAFMDPDWLSNSYVVSLGEGEDAVLIDSGAPWEDICRYVDRTRVTVRMILCTHHHHDHITHNRRLRERWGCKIGAHPKEISLISEAEVILEHGQALEVGALSIKILHIPGHTAGQLGFFINEEALFTGDTLFRGSVGGTCGPGHTTYEDLKHSIMNILMQTPSTTQIYPGHAHATSTEAEWNFNPFVRYWRGIESEHVRTCQALGRRGKLILEARDYDGGTKGLVEFDEPCERAIVPGSAIRKE